MTKEMIITNEMLTYERQWKSTKSKYMYVDEEYK